MTASVLTAAFLALAGWLYLLGFRGGFWRADQRLPQRPAPPKEWPKVVAVVPARDEAAVIGRAVRSLLDQDYPGAFSVVVVDDGSTDGTGAVARDAANASTTQRLNVVTAGPPPHGWTGKMWAVARGVRRAPADTDFLLLTDADVEHDPANLRRLVALAKERGLDLASVMVRLHCESAVERLLIPAFVFFFQKLYPFRWINDPAKRTAGAAGGCMLVRREALARAGGIEAVRGALIDDCALARRLKPAGPLWLGLATDTRSVRPYRGLSGIWTMVARTAFTQLNHSPMLLLATVLGMALLYVMPVFAVLWGLAAQAWAPALIGGAALALMAVTFAPTWAIYRKRTRLGVDWPLLALPAAGLLYTLMTVDSAMCHWRGAGGLWKGRVFSAAPGPRADGESQSDLPAG